MDLTRVFYDDATEAASRIAVDMMLLACKIHVIKLHAIFLSPKKRKVASRLAWNISPQYAILTRLQKPHIHGLGVYSI